MTHRRGALGRPHRQPERDPIDALTATLDDLAALARARLSEELGVRLPDSVAEIGFPAGGRPTERIHPSARAGSGTSGAAGTPDLKAIVRRLLLAATPAEPAGRSLAGLPKITGTRGLDR